MDLPQIIALIAAAGGGAGLSKFLHLFRATSPRETTVREFRNRELSDIRAALVQFDAHFVHNSGMLVEIQNTIKATARKLDNRLDEHDETLGQHHDRLSDLEEFKRRLEGKDRPR